MPVEVVMPKFGLTMQEGTIQQWFKAEGEPITAGQPLFEVETEKVLYDVEAPASGVVAKVLFPAEATVPCARVVAVIAVDGEDPAAVAARYAAAAPLKAGTAPSETRGANRPAALTPTLSRAGSGMGEGALAFHRPGRAPLVDSPAASSSPSDLAVRSDQRERAREETPAAGLRVPGTR